MFRKRSKTFQIIDNGASKIHGGGVVRVVENVVGVLPAGLLLVVVFSIPGGSVLRLLELSIVEFGLWLDWLWNSPSLESKLIYKPDVDWSGLSSFVGASELVAGTPVTRIYKAWLSLSGSLGPVFERLGGNKDGF